MMKNINDQRMKDNYISIFKKLLDMTEDGFIVTDPDGIIIEINNSYCEFLGITKKIALGKNILEFIKNSKMTKITHDRIEEKNVIHEFAENEYYKGNRYVIVSRSPVINENEVVAAIAQIKFRDKTENLLKKLEEKDIELKKQNNQIEFYKEEFKKNENIIFGFNSIIGTDDNFTKLIEIAKKASLCNLPVLITGETGTGKEVFAKSIHYESSRKNNILVSLNCAAIPSELLEMELFGYEEGSFTSARKGGKKGKFEIADKGTLFLDEIGDMSLNMQAKLLRVLQEKCFEKIGGYEPIPIDVRIISATNKDLWKLVKENKFREDLYYRLNVINFTIPPLRDRKADILPLMEYFLRELNQTYKKTVKLSDKAEELLIKHKWEGNVRELKNVIESAYVFSENDVIGIKSLPNNLLINTISDIKSHDKCKLDYIVETFERGILLDTIIQCEYNVSDAANKLGIHRTTLYKKLERMNLDINDIKRSK